MILLQINEGLTAALEHADKGAKRGVANKYWYTSAVAKFLLFINQKGYQSADAITEKIARDFAEWLKSDAASDRVKFLRPRTQKNHIDAMSALCNHLITSGTLEENPFESVSAPPSQTRDVKAISIEGRRAMLEASERDLRDHAILLMYAYSGVRLSELTEVMFDDVDFERCRVRVRKGKGEKERIVFVKPRVMEAVKKYLKHRPKSNWENVFVTDRFPYAPLSRSGMGQIFARYARIANVPPPNRPHSFRHRLAKDLIDAGADIKMVADVLGHEDPMFTARVYLQYDVEELAEQYERFMPDLE